MRQASIPHNVDLIGEIKHTLCVKTNWVLLSSRYFNLRVLVQQVLSSNPALPSLAVPVYFCRQSGTVSEVAVWVRYPLSYHHILRSGFVLCASLECRRSDKGELSPKCGPLSTPMWLLRACQSGVPISHWAVRPILPHNHDGGFGTPPPIGKWGVEHQSRAQFTDSQSLLRLLNRRKLAQYN